MDFKKEREYIGADDQLFQVKEYTFSSGRSRGVRAIDISNGAGMEVTILPDRCMDVYQIKYRGIGLNYLTKTGVSAPWYFDEMGQGWGANFPAGFFSTCGMKNIGLGGEDEFGRSGLHGNASNIPCEHVNILRTMEDGVPAVEISGTMRDCVLFGMYLTLTRTYKIKYGVNAVEFTDRIENIGRRTSPLMLLYHFNMGYPLLQEDSELILPTKKVTPRTRHAADFADEYRKITPPADGYEEMCYYHDIDTDAEGFATVGMRNSRLGLGVKITFSKDVLPKFVQWKMLGKGEYVTGLEPCNATIDGRADARENGSLRFIVPGETVTVPMRIEVFG